MRVCAAYAALQRPEGTIWFCGGRFLSVPTVLLIDDIYTTGSTVDAAAMVLKEKGVEKVYFLTISIGQGF